MKVKNVISILKCMDGDLEIMIQKSNDKASYLSEVSEKKIAFLSNLYPNAHIFPIVSDEAARIIGCPVKPFVVFSCDNSIVKELKENETTISLSEDKIILICRALQMGIWYRSGLVEGEHVDLALIHKWEGLKYFLLKQAGLDTQNVFHA